jgi:hypothetical protein
MLESRDTILLSCVARNTSCRDIYWDTYLLSWTDGMECICVTTNILLLDTALESDMAMDMVDCLAVSTSCQFPSSPKR